MEKKKTLVSGIQSSGTLHLGNYFGAMRQNITLSNSGEFDAYIFIADYHSMTSLTDREARRTSTFQLACAYLACGLDVSKVTLFRQSDVPLHTELAWMLSTVTPMAMLELAHSYKDKQAKGLETNVGLFTYPVLMASDILMYNADVVPVGKDQIQHIEMTREIAGKFNRAYNIELFKAPKEYVIGDVAVVPGTDGQKMSKSYGNVIPLFGTDEEIKKAVMGIVTDSARPEDKKNPDENSVYKIHTLFLNEEEGRVLRARYEEGGLSYKEAKESLLADLLRYIGPMREKYDYYQTHQEEVYAILEEGKRKANEKAERMMREVRGVVGL
jgi:tryptophanyl-tRNA synthetase